MINIFPECQIFQQEFKGYLRWKNFFFHNIYPLKMDYQVIKLRDQLGYFIFKNETIQISSNLHFNKKELESCQFFITTEVATTGVL